MVRIATLGVGAIGKTHCRNLAQIPGCQLVGVYDPDAETAERVASQYRCRHFETAEMLCDSPNVDAVDICTPTPWHHSLCLLAAKHKKHVITEKPMARTSDKAREMAKACEAAGVQLFVGQVLRFFPEFVKGREIALSGELGRHIIARTTRGGRFPMGSSNWFGDLEQSGGVILDMMIHDLDWLRWTFGEPESIFCRSIAATREPPPDYALATLKFQNGMLAHVEASWAHYSSFSVRVEVVGEHGVMELDNARTNPIKLVQRDPDGAPGLEIPENPALKNPYYLELEHFVRVMEGREECRVSPQDGIRAVEMCEAAIKSALTGEVVSLVSRNE